LDVDEKKIEEHVNSEQHKDNKAKVSSTNTTSSGNSVVEMWRKSLQD